MSDIKCPYCDHEQEVCHDDGQGYDEDITNEQHCISCDKPFKFMTNISYSYEVYCQDGDHIMEPFGDKWPDMYQCKNCEFYEKVEGGSK